MKTFFLKTAVFLLVFLGVVALKFPYDSMLESSVRRLEEATGATVLYRPVKAGPLGVRVSDLQIRTRSGATLRFDSAKVFPTRQGLRGTAYQGENEMLVNLSLSELKLQLTDISVETGSRMVGKARVTGNLDYTLAIQEGGGELRLVVPELKLPLPVPDQVLEIGATYQIRQTPNAENPWTGVNAKVRLIGGQLFTGDGIVSLQPQPPASPLVNGNLNFEGPTGKGVLRLSGTWDNMITNVIPR